MAELLLAHTAWENLALELGRAVRSAEVSAAVVAEAEIHRKNMDQNQRYDFGLGAKAFWFPGQPEFGGLPLKWTHSYRTPGCVFFRVSILVVH